MKQRVLTASIILPIFLLIMFSKNNIILFCFINLISILGLHEYYKSFHLDKGFYTIGMLLSLTYNLLVSSSISNSFITFMLISSFIVISLALFKYNTNSLSNVIITISGILYVPFLFSFVWLIYSSSNTGYLLAWFIFVISWSTDTCACLIGSYMGKRRITPVLSPKKSLEGFLGGTICTTTITLLLGCFFNLHFNISNNNFLLFFIVAGLIGSITSQIGDLTASAVKRLNNIKDFGAIFPGHGGILDRFDSVLFVAPTVYLLAHAFNLI